MADLSLFKQCWNGIPDSDQAVKQYCSILQERYCFVPPQPTERIVMCEWQVKYQTQAQAALKVATALIGPVAIKRFQIVKFTTYHNLATNEADSYLKRVLSFRNGNTPAVIFGALTGFLIMAAIVYLVAFISFNRAFLSFDDMVQIALIGVFILVCVAILIALVIFLKNLGNRIYPPDTHFYLQSDQVTLSRLAIYDSNQRELAHVKVI